MSNDNVYRAPLDPQIEGRFLEADRSKRGTILLHHLWGKAKDGPSYNKQEWLELQKLIEG